MPSFAPISLTTYQQAILRRWAKQKDQRIAIRARILLLADRGGSNLGIARELKVSRFAVIANRRKFIDGGVFRLETLSQRLRNFLTSKAMKIMQGENGRRPSTRSLARQFQVSHMTIHRIWKSMTPQIGRSRPYKPKLSQRNSRLSLLSIKYQNHKMILIQKSSRHLLDDRPQVQLNMFSKNRPNNYGSSFSSDVIITKRRGMKIMENDRKSLKFQRTLHSSCAAFSLVELLIVMAIISILAAILLPALAQARSNAKKIACMANFRQIYSGGYMYAENFRGYFPPNSGSSNSSPTWSHPYWYESISLYTGPLKNNRFGITYCIDENNSKKSIFFCPSFSPIFNNAPTGFGLNMALTNYCADVPFCILRYSGSASNTILIIDSDNGCIGSINHITYRHNKTSNNLRVDGSVNTISYLLLTSDLARK